MMAYMSIDTKPLQHPAEFDALCDDAKSRIVEISPDDVYAKLQNKEDFLLVDVRDRDEFDQFTIGGAQFMSKGWIEAKIHTIAGSKETPMVLYCGGGNRSALAADNLQKMGYTAVVSMEGGIKAWVNKGLPVTEKA